MPQINGVTVTTELEAKLMTALSDLYKITYYYFRKTSNVSEETQAKRVLSICKMLDTIREEFNPPVDSSEESTPSTAQPDGNNEPDSDGASDVES